MPVRFLSFSNDSALCADAVRSYTKNRLVRTLIPSINLFRAAAFSRQMSLFFKYHINGLLQGLWVSIVYAGGDDVFLVGAWNHTLQAALRIQKHLRSYTCGALTISAGIAMFNEHYSIRAAAEQTAALEELCLSAELDALRISDAMPWRGDAFYLPKPIAASTSPAELSTVERKAVKKLACTPAPTRWTSWTRAFSTGMPIPLQRMPCWKPSPSSATFIRMPSCRTSRRATPSQTFRTPRISSLAAAPASSPKRSVTLT